MSLDPEFLKAFVAVADCGGFTRAAEALNRTQAAVSQQVKKLEERLNVRLFDRHSRMVVLSPHGQILMGYARQILSLQDEALRAFSDTKAPQRIRLGTPDDYAISFMPGIISSFSHNHPNVEVEVRCALSVELIKDFHKNEVDLALVTRMAGDRGGQDIRTESLAWVSAPNSMTHTKEVLPLALFTSLDEECWFRNATLRLLNEMGRKYCVTYSSRSTTVLLSAVRAGLAIGVFARSSVPPDLTILNEDDGLPALPDVQIALHRQKNLNDPIVSEFADLIVNTLSTEHLSISPGFGPNT